jgi:biopolymer transport protein ExbD
MCCTVAAHAQEVALGLEHSEMQTPSPRNIQALAFALMVTASLAACSRAEPPTPGLVDVSVNRILNKVTVTGTQVRWNDKAIDEQQLTRLLARSRTIDPEPELQFQPDANASYEVLARVLEIIKDSGGTKFGFVGNEAYSPSASPTG